MKCKWFCCVGIEKELSFLFLQKVETSLNLKELFPVSSYLRFLQSHLLQKTEIKDNVFFLNIHKYQKPEWCKVCSSIMYQKPSLLGYCEIAISDQCFISCLLVLSQVITNVPSILQCPVEKFINSHYYMLGRYV